MDRRRFLQVSAAVSGGIVGTAQAAASDSSRLAVVRDVITAWRRQDLEGMLKHIHDEIVWHSHVGSPPLVGKAAMREFAGKLGGSMSDIRWRIFEAVEQGDRMHVEGVDDFVNKDGRRVVIPYAGVLGFRGAQIVEWRDYFDRALFDRLNGGEALPAYLEPIVNREALF